MRRKRKGRKKSSNCTGLIVSFNHVLIIRTEKTLYLSCSPLSQFPSFLSNSPLHCILSSPSPALSPTPPSSTPLPKNPDKTSKPFNQAVNGSSHCRPKRVSPSVRFSPTSFYREWAVNPGFTLGETQRCSSKSPPTLCAPPGTPPPVFPRNGLDLWALNSPRAFLLPTKGAKGPPLTAVKDDPSEEPQLLRMWFRKWFTPSIIRVSHTLS